MSARTVDDVMKAFEDPLSWVSRAQMAEYIVELETKIATLDAERAGVVTLNEWRVVTRDGKPVNAISDTVERSAQIDCHGYDSDFPGDAPHRVMRVCLTPTTPEAQS